MDDSWRRVNAAGNTRVAAQYGNSVGSVSPGERPIES